jgi:hypothetical protein
MIAVKVEASRRFLSRIDEGDSDFQEVCQKFGELSSGNFEVLKV